MAMRGSTDLDYTWYGVLVTDCDALLVLEKCLRGELAHIPRRPHDSERARLIKSGSIFVYESNASGIKRWTDGINWSPSRILTNFLVYHELEKAPPPGEKKRAIKRKRSETDFDDADPKTTQRTLLEEDWTDDDRRLMGSPQDNYGWKVAGLVKKTYSFDFRGASHHIISYFNPDDVRTGELKRPIHCREFQDTFIRPELIEQGARSRNPITEAQIEQQRWERPLYQVESSVSLMRQFPLQSQTPFSAPAQMPEYHSHRPTLSQPHGLVHRSSIHFPMDDTTYSSAAAAPFSQHLGHPSLHGRHASMSSAIPDEYQRTHVRDSLGRNVAPLDTSEAPYHAPASALHHPRRNQSLNTSPVDLKPATLVEEDESHDAPYASMPQHHNGYAVASPPMAMHSLDTSYSHTVSRPPLYHGPHSSVDLHPQHSFSSGEPPARKPRIEPAYPNMSSSAWERPVPAPASAHETPASHADFGVHIPLESFSFAQPSHSFTATHGLSYSHAPDSAAYGDINTDFAGSQTPALFSAPSYTNYSLTAPS